MNAETDSKPKAPGHFPAYLRRWWDSHVEEFALDGSELQVLEAMGDCWLDYVGLRKALRDAKEFTFVDRHGSPKERPELGAMNRCRVTFARLRRELSLPIEEPGNPRMPRTNGRRS
jgi:hypothetical protein